MNLSKSIGKLALIAGLFFASAGLASTAEDFKAANQLYDTGKFADAAAAYEKIEPKTAHVYFNLGNALFREGKLGLAVLNYSRANRLAPRDPDILANLKFAQQRLGVDDVNTPPNASRRFFASLLASRTLDEWSAGELTGLWVLILAIAAAIFLPKLRTGFMVVSAIALAVFGFSAFALGYETINERSAPAAIVVTAETEARFAPVADSTVHFRLREGTRVKIDEDRGEWVLAERADGQQGWIRTDSIQKIARAS